MHARQPRAGQSLPFEYEQASTVRAWQALRYRDFRLLWTALAGSAIGTWMQIVAQSLLVLDLTHGSATALGTLSLTQAVAFLAFTALGGSAADRFDKRRLLLLTQSLLMAIAFLLGVLTAAGMIRFWMILLAAFSSSAILSFDQPTRNALIASLVPREALMNAVSLQSAVFNGASLVGPALAGVTLHKIGYSVNFFLNAASFVLVMGALLSLRISLARAHRKAGEGLLESVCKAVAYIRNDAILPSAVSVYGALLFFGPSAALVLPVFATSVLHTGPVQLGVLFSAIGAGAFAGTLIVASRGDSPHKRRLLFGSVLVWTAALAVFGLCTGLITAVPALFILGAAQSAAGAVTVTLLQTRVLPDMRGRAMSLNTLLIMCVRPLGDFPAGTIIGWLGLRPTLLFGAALVGTTLLAIFFARPAAFGDLISKRST